MDRGRLPDLFCFSHLRWNFVYQRPQHLMTRFARVCRVFFVEEPVFDSSTPRLEITRAQGVHVVVPHLPTQQSEKRESRQRSLLDEFSKDEGIRHPILWYYTPMALSVTRHLPRLAVVYDCMDELSAFAFAPPNLPKLEEELFGVTDLVFAGGHSLYEAKRHRHPAVYLFPSSVDADHFGRARTVYYEGLIDLASKLGYKGAVPKLRENLKEEEAALKTLKSIGDRMEVPEMTDGDTEDEQ